MSSMLELELGAESLERSKVDLAVAGVFSDQLPLRGGAGRVDWRLCGLVSDQILAGRFSGARGEALLVPTSGQLRANRVMAVGLGARSDYRLAEVTGSVQEAVSRAVALGSPSLGMAPLGLAGDEFPRCAEAIVAGAVAGFADSPHSMRLRVVLPAEEINRAALAIEAALDTLKTPRVRLRRPSLSSSPRAYPQDAASGGAATR